MKKAIKCLKNGKASGPEEITSELLKNGSEKLFIKRGDRLYGRILPELKEEDYKPFEEDEQGGFRAGRSDR